MKLHQMFILSLPITLLIILIYFVSLAVIHRNEYRVVKSKGIEVYYIQKKTHLGWEYVCHNEKVPNALPFNGTAITLAINTYPTAEDAKKDMLRIMMTDNNLEKEVIYETKSK